MIKLSVPVLGETTSKSVDRDSYDFSDRCCLPDPDFGVARIIGTDFEAAFRQFSKSYSSMSGTARFAYKSPRVMGVVSSLPVLGMPTFERYLSRMIGVYGVLESEKEVRDHAESVFNILDEGLRYFVGLRDLNKEVQRDQVVGRTLAIQSWIKHLEYYGILLPKEKIAPYLAILGGESSVKRRLEVLERELGDTIEDGGLKGERLEQEVRQNAGKIKFWLNLVQLNGIDFPHNPQKDISHYCAPRRTNFPVGGRILTRVFSGKRFDGGEGITRENSKSHHHSWVTLSNWQQSGLPKVGILRGRRSVDEKFDGTWLGEEFVLLDEK